MMHLTEEKSMTNPQCEADPGSQLGSFPAYGTLTQDEHDL